MKGFEKSCDDAVTAYLVDSQRIAFGEAPVINYIAALETEGMCITQEKEQDGWCVLLMQKA